jgi:hypothetical protein
VNRKLYLVALVGVLLASVYAVSASAGTGGGTGGVTGTPTVTPIALPDSSLKAEDTTVGGATVLPTTRTVPHWFGTSLNPSNGVTYGYNMVGADPFTCSGATCSTTVQADITPINVNIDGLTFSGSAVLPAVLASPVFQLNDYGSTPAATAAGSFPNAPALVKGPGGVLSQGDAGIPLQLEDATMRAQFNKTGAGSSYHLMLSPNVLPAVTINVPRNQGTLLISGRGVVGADIDIGWWSAQIKNLETKADSTHLPIYLTNQVFLYEGNNPGNCCVIGYHGTNPVGNGGGSGNSNGNAQVQTFAWASYVQPGFYSRANGGTDWAIQDIHALSHELSEWSDDPFVNNTVQPWLTPTAPQYGCSNFLETGDPVVGIGFSMGTNTYFQNTNPDGSVSYDGTYHPEDEVFLPWFMRTAPNTISELTQSPSTNVGRYTFMGDLNPFPGFRQPATGC